MRTVNELELVWISVVPDPIDPNCTFDAVESRSGDRMQPQAAKPEPDPILGWESEGGHSGLRAKIDD